MEGRSQTRGSSDTHAWAALVHVRSPAQRAFRIALIVAFLLHLPFVPTRLFLWMSILWNSGPIELADMDGEVIVPIDFDIVDDQTNSGAGPAATAAAEAADPNTFTEPVATAPKTPAKKPDPDASDAGVDAEPPDASTDATDSDASDASADAASDPLDAGIDDGGPSDASAPATSNDAGAVEEDAAPPMARAEKDGGSGGILPASTDAGLPAVPTTNIPDGGPVDAGSVDGGSTDAGPATHDPLVAAGSPSSLAEKNPNVTIFIAGDRLRKYELGAMFGDVLSAIPEWKTFIRTILIEPVNYVDHMLIAGPQLRDSSKVVVVMDLNVPDAKARATIDGIIKRSKPPGKWLEGKPVPAATGQAAKSERIFAMVPGKHLVVVLPASARDQLPRVKAAKPFKKSSAVGISLYLVNPANAFKGLPFKIPNTLKWLRINVIPTDDSGVDVVLEAEDKDESLAREHAAQLELLIESLRSYEVPFLGTKVEILGKTSFTSEGSFIRARTHATKKQLIYIMGFAKKQLETQAKQGADAGPSK